MKACVADVSASAAVVEVSVAVMTMATGGTGVK